MKKQLFLTALMTVTVFSAQASAGLALRTGLAGAGILATTGFIMVNESTNNLINGACHFVNELLSTTTTQEVITPLIRTATEKSQFLRKLATGLAMCAAVSFISTKLVEKHDAYILTKALKRQIGRLNINNATFKGILEKK